MICNGPEYEEVEQPFIDQLIAMGWKHTTGSLDNPCATDRESFRDVLLQEDLRQALRRSSGPELPEFPGVGVVELLSC